VRFGEVSFSFSQNCLGYPGQEWAVLPGLDLMEKLTSLPTI